MANALLVAPLPLGLVLQSRRLQNLTASWKGQPTLYRGCGCHGLCNPDVLLRYELPDDIEGRLYFFSGQGTRF